MGGFGAVFRAEHLALRRAVALKILFSDREGFELLAARMQREALVGAHVVHPHIAATLDFGALEDGSRYLVSELVPGRTLRDAMRDGPMPVDRASKIALGLLDALAACHDRGVVHRDLKPGNVMLDEAAGDVAKLIDFGLAKVPVAAVPRSSSVDDDGPATDENLTTRGIVFGTVAYMAPETAEGMAAVGPASDLYALGVILYEMLAGKHPFEGDDPAELFLCHRVAPPPSMGARGGVRVATEIEAVVGRLLAKSPRDRYPDARAARAAWSSAVGPRSVPPSAPSLGPVTMKAAIGGLPPRAATRRSRFVLAAAAGLAALGLVSAARWRARTEVSPASSPAPAVIEVEAPSSEASSSADRARDSVEAAFARDAARARFRSAADRGRISSAVAELRELIVRDPHALAGAEDRRRAAKVAYRAALAELKSTEALFDALAERAGQDGLDVLYDLVEGQGGTRAAELAASRLERRDVRARANAALDVALALRGASCGAKARLFDRAGEVGDARARRILEGMRASRCVSKRGECCYHGDPGLARAVDAIDRRSGRK